MAYTLTPQAFTLASGTLGTNTAAPRQVLPGTVHFAGGFNYFDLPTPMYISFQERVIYRTPATLTVILYLAPPGGTATFRVDGSVVATGSVAQDGSCGPISLELPPLDAGTHVLTATVSGVTVTLNFTVRKDPRAALDIPAADATLYADPAALVNGVYRWTLVSPGDKGTFVFPHNPRTMQPIPRSSNVTAQHTTSQTGQFHLTEAEPAPLPWSFAGYTDDRDFQSELEDWGNYNRRFYLIDHRNRGWIVTFTSVQFVPRKRQRDHDGADNDWGADYTVNAVMYDQNPITPQDPP